MIAKGIKLDKMITLHAFLETQKHAVHDPAVAEEHLRRPEREEHLRASAGIVSGQRAF
jgi:hypothetical protein